MLGPGASLGEAALLGLLHVRTASVQALQDWAEAAGVELIRGFLKSWGIPF